MNHAICNLLYLPYVTQHHNLRFICVFACFIAESYPVIQIYLSLSIYLSNDIWVDSGLGKSVYKHSYTGFYMRISFPFFWVNIQEWDFWVYYEKLLNCFPAWLYFAFSPVNYESHGSFLPSSISVVCFFFGGGLVFFVGVFCFGGRLPHRYIGVSYHSFILFFLND